MESPAPVLDTVTAAGGVLSGGHAVSVDLARRIRIPLRAGESPVTIDPVRFDQCLDRLVDDPRVGLRCVGGCPIQVAKGRHQDGENDPCDDVTRQRLLPARELSWTHFITSPNMRALRRSFCDSRRRFGCGQQTGYAEVCSVSQECRFWNSSSIPSGPFLSAPQTTSSANADAGRRWQNRHHTRTDT